MKMVTVHPLSDDEARAITRRELQPVVDKMIRAAHKEGARGRTAYAVHCFTGQLLDASVCLGDEFRTQALSCVTSDAWSVSFGYTVRNHAFGIMMIRLK